MATLVCLLSLFPTPRLPFYLHVVHIPPFHFHLIRISERISIGLPKNLTKIFLLLIWIIFAGILFEKFHFESKSFNSFFIQRIFIIDHGCHSTSRVSNIIINQLALIFSFTLPLSFFPDLGSQRPTERSGF